MNTQKHTESIPIILVVLVAAMLAGCSSDDGNSLMDPQPEPGTIKALKTRLTITRFECLQDGDGVEGAGEFRFFVRANFYNEDWERTLSTGESSALNWHTDYYHENYTGEGRDLDPTFGCTEWDRNFLNREIPDSDMNERRGYVSYVMTEDLQETNYITMGNSNCRVRFHYQITSEVVDVE